MEYMMFVCADPEGEPYDAAEDRTAEWVAEAESTGSRIRGNRLRPAEDARTVRVRGGRLVVTDGPSSAAGVEIAGYDILECASLEEAVALAAKHPMARFGRIEVRPAWPFDAGD